MDVTGRSSSDGGRGDEEFTDRREDGDEALTPAQSYPRAAIGNITPSEAEQQFYASLGHLPMAA